MWGFFKHELVPGISLGKINETWKREITCYAAKTVYSVVNTADVVTSAHWKWTQGHKSDVLEL